MKERNNSSKIVLAGNNKVVGCGAEFIVSFPESRKILPNGWVIESSEGKRYEAVCKGKECMYKKLIEALNQGIIMGFSHSPSAKERCRFPEDVK